MLLGQVLYGFIWLFYGLIILSDLIVLHLFKFLSSRCRERAVPIRHHKVENRTQRTNRRRDIILQQRTAAACLFGISHVVRSCFWPRKGSKVWFLLRDDQVEVEEVDTKQAEVESLRREASKL